MKPRSKESERHVEAIVSALKIIDCFRSDEGLQLKELHYRTGINKSKILRLTGSMEAFGALSYDEETREYCLGPKLYHCGRKIGNRYRSLVSAADPLLAELSEYTGGVSYVSVRSGSERLVICRRQPGALTETVVKDGQVRPIYIGANGLILLAQESAQNLERIFDDLRNRPGMKLSEEHFALLAERARIARRDGYAVSFGESKRGYHVVSVPIFYGSGEFAGALGLSIVSGEDSKEAATSQVALLRDIAERLRERL